MPEFINEDHRIQYESIQQQLDFARNYVRQLEVSLQTLALAHSLKECIAVQNEVMSLTTVNDFRGSQFGSKFSQLFATIPNVKSMSEDKPEDFLGTILDTIQDVSGSHYNTLSNFVTNLATKPPEEAVKELALQELLASGWSLKVDINGDGKTAELIKGSDVVNFLTAGFNGDILTGNEILMGVVTKFEKEIFGFSIIEVGKEVDKFAKILSNGNPSADVVANGLFSMIDSTLNKVGGNSQYVKQIRGIIKTSKGLSDAYTKAKSDVNKAIAIYNKQKELISSSASWSDADLDAVVPEIPAIPDVPEIPETNEPVPPDSVPSHLDPNPRLDPGPDNELFEDPFDEEGTIYDEE